MKGTTFRVGRFAALLALCAIIFRGLERIAYADPPTNTDLIGQIESVHNTLFASPFNPDDWVYAIDEEFDGEGTYTGSITSGETFEIEIVDSVYVEPDPGDPGEPGHAVLAIITTGLGTAHMHGYVATRLVDGAVETALLPLGTVPADSPLFWADKGFIDEDAGIKPIETASLMVEKYNHAVTEARSADDDIVVPADCEERLAHDLDLCTETWKSQVRTCNRTYNNSVQNAWDSYHSCMRWCGPILLTCIAVCLAASGGWGSIFCYAGCAAAAAACDSNCRSNLNSALVAAKNVRSGCISNANSQRSFCEQSAVNDFEDCVADSQPG